MSNATLKDIQAICKNLPYQVQWSTELPHIAAVDILNNGTAREVAVMSVDNRNLDFYYVQINDLDEIDRRRLLKIVQSSRARDFTLFELMTSVSFQNGQNALEFFHQLAKVRTFSGDIFPATSNNRGRALTNAEKRAIVDRRRASEGKVRPVAQAAVQREDFSENQVSFDTYASQAQEPERKKAGRPRKS